MTLWASNYYHYPVGECLGAALPVLRHRILTNFAADSKGLKSTDIITRILDEVRGYPEIRSSQDRQELGLDPRLAEELMVLLIRSALTVQERNQYREQLRNMDSEEEREKLQAQHREQMQLRAKALELDIEEAE